MEYTHFTFDGVSSSRYNLYVQNKGEDLLFPSQPTFENQIISPIYQGANYLAGVNKKERIFSFNCWVDSLATDVLREMLNWLSVYKIGTLSLDFNPNFQYKVKINTLSDFKHFPINEDGTSNYEFQLSFITIGNPASESVVSYTLLKNDLVPSKDLADNWLNSVIGPNYDNGCPIAFQDNGQVKFFNYYSDGIPMLLDISTSEGFQVSLNNTIYYDYELEPLSSLTKFSIDTEYGFCKIGSQLAESVDAVTTNTNLGTMKIPSGEAQIFISNLVYWNEDTKIMQINNSNNIINYLRSEIAAGNLYVIVQDGSYGNDSTPGLPNTESIVI